MILETLNILIKSNADNAKKGFDNLKVSMNELDEKTSNASKSFNSFTNDVSGLVKEFAVWFLGATAVLDVIRKISSEEKSIISLNNLTQATGQSAEELSRLTSEIGIITGNGQGSLNSLSELNNKMVGLKWGDNSEFIQNLAMIGVSAFNSTGKVKTLTELLRDTHRAIKSMSDRDSYYWLNKAGFDNNTIVLLKQSDKEFNKIVASTKKYSEAIKVNSELMKKLMPEMGRLKVNSETIWLTISSKLVPVFERFIKWINSLDNSLDELNSTYEKHSEFFKVMIAGISGAIVAYYIPAMVSAIETTGLFLLEWLPFIAIASLIIGAIALIVDDFESFKKGQKSLIGTLINEWDSFKDYFIKLFDSIEKSFNKFIDPIVKKIEWLKSVKDSAISAISGDSDSEQTKKDTTTSGGYLGTDYDVPSMDDSDIEKLDKIKNVHSKVMDIKASYYLNALNASSPLSVANASRSSTQNNTFNINAPINANGMTSDDVHSLFSDKFIDLINNAVIHHTDSEVI